MAIDYIIALTLRYMMLVTLWNTGTRISECTNTDPGDFYLTRVQLVPLSSVQRKPQGPPVATYQGVSLGIENYCTLRLLFNQSLILYKVPECGKLRSAVACCIRSFSNAKFFTCL